jgi:hypothetical protein
MKYNLKVGKNEVVLEEKKPSRMEMALSPNR